MYPGVAGRGSRSALTKEMQFLEKVKTRLRSRELYSDFLKCLNMYSQDIISRPELVSLTADILGRNPDLMVGDGSIPTLLFCLLA
jgi:paired amphipathic helix protein Sin3a